MWGDMRPYRALLVFACFLPFVSLPLPFTATISFAQETTGGLQGTLKDGTGAVLPNVSVDVTSPSLVGGKATTTDKQGNYRFTNLPPGPYVVTARSKGFTTVRREGLIIEVGHLPTIDLTLAVGGETTVVEVSAESPVIDVTSTSTLTNITQDVIDLVPHGQSFQSVIQFAPSARQEPLMGNTTTNGSGSVSPGNGSNGNAFGYSIGGGADSENSYLVEGQETANLVGGYSHTNVPFDFIQEVQLKTSGIEAEHGGSLGGTVNVIMKKGSDHWHGSVFLQYSSNAMNGSPTATSRYDPNSIGTPSKTVLIDPTYQQYQAKKDKLNDFFPGFTIGGPIFKNRLFFFAAFNPEFRNIERKVNYNGSFGTANLGTLPFSQNTQTYYTTARLDAAATKKLHVFASWLYQGQRQSGQQLPFADDANGLFNSSTLSTPDVYAHSQGFASPNITTNFGGDYMISQNIVSTSRLGYYFENYHDFGYNGTSDIYNFQASGIGATDVNGQPLPANLQQGSGFQSGPVNANFTRRNANKHIQFDEAISWFKSGWTGTHNFKFGYQLNRESNDIFQGYNVPFIQVFPGSDSLYKALGSTGRTNCLALIAARGPQYGDPAVPNCTGTYGYEIAYDFGSAGKATSYNHSFFAQDSWTIGKGLTVNYGLRIEKEYLPASTTTGQNAAHPINFGWGDKIAPRVGAAWDVFRDGRMKVFGDYGVFNDVMKLNLAISSFGGQFWNNCAYALNAPDYTTANPVANSSGRYCVGDSTVGANFPNGVTPAGLTFIENVNNRSSSSVEPVAPGLKPYRQHEAGLGVDYQAAPTLAFEVRWDRRRLDHVIEDAALFDPSGSEVFTIVNPGQGPNATNTTCDPTSGVVPGCPSNIPAARSYDGVEFRVTKSLSQHWFGLFSYTYSHFRGNYTGLTSSDLADGGSGGRNAPNNSRSFDETYFQFNSHGDSSSGVLPTDRPNTLKGYAYYDFKWMKKFTTDVGIFQTIYQGSPVSSYVDVGSGGNAWPVYPENRGMWQNLTQDPVTGIISPVGSPFARRTPFYNQTDLNFKQTYNLTEGKAISFDATFANLLNERAVTAYTESVGSQYGAVNPNAVLPNGYSIGGCTDPSSCPVIYSAGQAYSAFEHPYDWKTLLNSDGMTLNSQYGKPFLFQAARNVRLQVHFTF
jgi:Carboxypeptidase regulatory-like domain